VPCGLSSRPGHPDFRQMHAHKTLVEQVKRLQRSNIETRDKWHQYCDRHRAGMYDPGQMTPQFIMLFLEQMGQVPVLPPPSAAAEPEPPNPQRVALVRRLEPLLRSSKKVDKAWHRACDLECGGDYDPNKLDVAFLQRFLLKHGDDAPDDRPSRRTSAAGGENFEWGAGRSRSRSRETWLQERPGDEQQRWGGDCWGDAAMGLGFDGWGGSQASSPWGPSWGSCTPWGLGPGMASWWHASPWMLGSMPWAGGVPAGPGAAAANGMDWREGSQRRGFMNPAANGCWPGSQRRPS